MKNLLIITFLFIFLIGTCLAQSNKTKKPSTKKSKLSLLEQMRNWDGDNDNCTFKNNHTPDQRLKIYPFDKAVKILAVSYDYDKFLDSVLKNSTTKKPDYPIKIVNGVLDTSLLVEVKELTAVNIGSLTNLLYNVGYRKKGFNGIPSAQCYQPRNAFIFVDKNNKAYDYLEICFECMRYHSKSENIDIGDVCSQKYELLRQYFIYMGIKFGVKKGH